MKTWTLTLLLLLVGGVAYAGGAVHGYLSASTLETPRSAYDVTPDERATFDVRGFAFKPGTVDVRAGALTELVIENHDSTFHTFSYAFDGRQFDHGLEGGAVVRVLVRFPEAGEIPFYCAPHRDMTGTIIVGGA